MKDTKDYVLFSPVGTTDPISNGHDGALLHICRYYRPHTVYLYLSKEMMSYRDQDDRYRYCLRQLAELLGTDFEIHEIERPELENVQRFDRFYEDFHQELKEIRAKHPQSQILLNISSGTPAMKSALQVISALGEEDFLAIQVDSPNKSSNPRREDIKKYALKEEWECNCDNEKSAEPRTVESEHLNLLAKFKKEMIVKHLEAYDYNAALSIAQTIPDHVSKDAMLLFRAAVSRLQLDQSEMDKILKGTDYIRKLIPLQSTDERAIMEFLLWLQVKVRRGDHADFVRGITPVVADLLERILKQKYGVDIRKYCQKKTQRREDGERSFDIYYLQREKLEKDEEGRKLLGWLDEGYRKEYHDTHLTSSQMTILLQRFAENDPAFQKRIAEIRTVEESVRNLVAHEVVSITPEWMKKQCGLNVEEVMKRLKQLARDANLNVREEAWDSYDEMNRLICEMM